jgi:hypothetical protein
MGKESGDEREYDELAHFSLEVTHFLNAIKPHTKGIDEKGIEKNANI